jgi:hypothetical protein
VLICRRAAAGVERVDPGRATILTDGVSSCVVSATPGRFRLLSCTSQTNLEIARSGSSAERPALSVVRACGTIAVVADLLYESAGLICEMKGLTQDVTVSPAEQSFAPNRSPLPNPELLPALRAVSLPCVENVK